MKKLYLSFLRGLFFLLAVYVPALYAEPAAARTEPEEERRPSVSRTVAMSEKQRVEIAYPGQGWVYIGEQSSQPGIRYEQRKLSDNATVFTFTGEKKGSYILYFSYFDVFTDDFITDSIAVTVGAAKDGLARTVVKAPEYNSPRKDAVKTITAGSASALPNTLQPAAETPAASATPTASAPAAAPIAELPAAVTPQDAVPAVKPTAQKHTVGSQAAASEDLSALNSEELLQKVREATNAADAAAALRYLAAFFEIANENIDEALFLQGKVYELNTGTRNIRLALNAYKTLTAEYPQSTHWAAADSRIRYITAFYINIR